MKVEKGAPFLTGEEGLLAGLVTGASNSEGERAEVAPGFQGEVVLHPSLSPAQTVSVSKQFRSLREETAGMGQQDFGIHRPGESGRAHCKSSP